MSTLPPPLPRKKNRIGLYLLLVIASLAGIALLGLIAMKVRDKVALNQQKVAGSRQAMAHFQKENVDNLRKVVESEDSVAASGEMLDSAQKKLGTLAETMPPLEKAIMLAGQEVMVELQEPLKNYQATYADLLKNQSFAATGIHTLEDVEQRRRKVQVFGEANQSLKASSATLGEHFYAKLRARGISEEQSESAKKGFIRSSQSGLTASIREDDEQLCQQMITVLDLYKKSWGKWKMNEKEQLIFQDEADLASYNRSITAIQAIAKHQAETQQKMLAIQEASAKK